MNNKKILSFILSIMMLLQVLATPIEAAGTLSQSAKSDKSVSEGTFIDEKTQVFTFANTNQSSEAAGELRSAAPRRLKLFAPVPATSKTEKATISLDMIGIETDFDWTVFGNANAFKAWIAVQYKGETGFTKVSQKVSIDANHADPINVDVTVDEKKQVEYYSIVTEYDNDASRFKIRAAFSQGAPVSSGEPLNFDLTVVEMVNTKIQYEYLDEYGNVTTEDAPTTNLTNLAKFGSVDFDAKTSGEDVLWKTKSLDPFDYQDKTIQLTVNKDNFKENNVFYKVTSNYDYKTGGKITIKRQKDVVIPPTGDDGNPVKVADGYVRVTFDPTDKAQNQTKTYYDVKDTLTWEQAKAATPAVAEPSDPTPTDDKKVFDAWLDNTVAEGSKKLSQKSGNVGKSPVTFTAQYTDKIIVNPDPGEEPSDQTHVKLTFKANNADDEVADGKVYVDKVSTNKDTIDVYVLNETKWDDADLKAELAKITAKSEAGKKTFVKWLDAQKAEIPTTNTDVEAKEFTAQYTAGSTPTDQSKTPTIDQPYEGDDKITGKGEPGAKIEVKDEGGNKIGKTTVKPDKTWEVDVPQNKPLKKGDKITATQTETGKRPSEEAEATVEGKYTPPTHRYTTLTLDENYRGGEITHHDVLEGDLIERYLYVPRRRGYVFEGWSYNSRRLDEVRPGYRIYYPTTLYAIWSKDRDYDRDEREEEPEDLRPVHDHDAYMFGYTDGTVRPNGKITRAEAAALVTRLLGLDTFASAAKPVFSDTPSSWYNKAINAAVQRGIMKGYPDGRFRPNAPITRAEFTQMISTIDNKPYGVAPFADVKGHWAERPIGSEYQAGRIMGYPDQTFRPNAFITRCEAVVILNKMFERNYDAMSLKDAKNAYLIKGFIDLPTSFWGYYDMIEATNSHSFKRRTEGKVQEDWTLVK